MFTSGCVSYLQCYYCVQWETMLLCRMWKTTTCHVAVYTQNVVRSRTRRQCLPQNWNANVCAICGVTAAMSGEKNAFWDWQSATNWTKFDLKSKTARFSTMVHGYCHQYRQSLLCGTVTRWCNGVRSLCNRHLLCRGQWQLNRNRLGRLQ